MQNLTDLENPEKMERLYNAFYHMRNTVGISIPAHLSSVEHQYPILSWISNFSEPAKTRLQNRLHTIVNEAYLHQQTRTKKYLKHYQVHIKFLRMINIEVNKETLSTQKVDNLQTMLKEESMKNEPKKIHKKIFRLTFENICSSTAIPKEKIPLIHKLERVYLSWLVNINKLYDAKKINNIVKMAIYRRSLKEIAQQLSKEILQGELEEDIKDRYFKILLQTLQKSNS